MGIEHIHSIKKTNQTLTQARNMPASQNSSLAKIAIQMLALSATVRAYNRQYWRQVYDARKQAVLTADELMNLAPGIIIDTRTPRRGKSTTLSQLQWPTTCSISWWIMIISTRPIDSFTRL